MKKDVWRIFVPVTRRDNGKKYPNEHHWVWDNEVIRICGGKGAGLTILDSGKGKWVSPLGEMISEKMIPVEIACTREQIERIILMTQKYYDQLEILCYRLSDLVLLASELA